MREQNGTMAPTPAPVATSAHSEAPTPLAIVPDTPVVDLESGLVGKVVAVAPAFCVFAVEEGLWICPWRQVAVGNIAPAREGWLAHSGGSSEVAPAAGQEGDPLTAARTGCLRRQLP